MFSLGTTLAVSAAQRLPLFAAHLEEVVMRSKRVSRFTVSVWRRCISKNAFGRGVLLLAAMLFADISEAADLRVMMTGLGSGTVSGMGISCGSDCDETSSTPITLTAAASAGSIFSRWEGDCSGTAATCTVLMTANRSVRALFDLSPAISPLGGFTPADIEAYLAANPQVNSPARFIAALPMEFKQNWILMSRSESLQTGIARSPRILLPSADARFVFTVGMTTHSSYPGSHPHAIEYMQWDPVEKNFRFHEIVLDAIPAMGVFPARSRGVSRDDAKCFACHSTRNVPSLDRSVIPPVPGSISGTDGIPPGTVKSKSKPNWDSYDSWGGMLPFNRDRIYQGSVEAATFRKIFNLWTWRANILVRSIIEQLELQPPGVPPAHVITRTNGGANDGYVNFVFDTTPPVLTEPAPTGTDPAITTSYLFNGLPGAGAGTAVVRGGAFVTLHHSGTPMSDEGRGVQLFDLLGGADGNLNQQRIADELINHRFAPGSVPIDVRPIALAITKGCVNVSGGTIASSPALTIDFGFFNARNGISGINDLVNDTAGRRQSLPRRKADIEKFSFDRTGDPYLVASENGLIQEYGAATSAGTDTSLARVRQEVFRRPTSGFSGDSTVMGGIYVDREIYNNDLIALYRYFLEPLGVSVDRWSMGVRGRSRAYTFADVFFTYTSVLQSQLEASLISDPVAGLTAPFNCVELIAAVNSTLLSLPPANAVPTYTDVQRIFNKSCIECHGGLGYPPYPSTFLDLSENESPASGETRLTRSHNKVLTYTTTDPATSYLYQRIIQTSEACPGGLMPCGGPSLSKADIETIRRWIVGPPSRPGTVGDPHIRTIEGINYDFQSAGEFVLLRSEGMELQARQTAVETESPLGPNPYTGLGSCVSVNTAVAVRVGPHRITYQPHLSGEPDATGLQLRVDGKLMELRAEGISLPSGGRIIRNLVSGGLQIEPPGGTAFVITPGWWDYYRMWYLNIDVTHPRATEGIMGSIAPQNWLPALPDGTLLGLKPAGLHQRYLDLYEKFADAWRVTKSNSLFDYAPGTSTDTFTVRSWPEENPQSCTLPPTEEGPPRKPPVKPVKLEVAQQQCRGIDAEDRRANCVQDVMITGEVGFARTYMIAEKIARNGRPTVPHLVSPENESIGLPSSVGFIWKKSTDPDGDPVTYRFCLWAVENGFHESDCTPVAGHLIATQMSPMLSVGVGSLLLLGLLVPGMRKRNNFLSLVIGTTLFTIMLSGCSLIDMTTRIDTVGKTVSGLDSNKAYFWKVVAQDDKGGSTESETWRFTTQ